MKKTVLLLALVLLLSGCGKAAEKTEDANTGAETAYMEFLSGRSSVTTAECFRDDDQEYNQDGLAFGTYTIGEMRSAIAEYEMSESAVKYTFFDFGNDGTEELIIMRTDIARIPFFMTGDISKTEAPQEPELTGTGSSRLTAKVSGQKNTDRTNITDPLRKA